MSQFVLGPSPFDSEHSSLLQRLTQLHDDISRLTAEAATVEQQIAATLVKKQTWEQQETERLQREREEKLRREEEERLERERVEKERLEAERLEKERLERERLERERVEREEQERIARERAETEARLEAEKQAKQAEKERLEREWLEREKQEQLTREANERQRKETEAALAAAAASAIAAQSASGMDGGVDGAGAGVAPTELHVRAKALYDLDGDEANEELSFVTGDLFTVSGEMNGWMSARHERTGKVGLVPSNYIQVIEQLEPITAATTTTTTSAIDTAEAKEETKEQDTATTTTAVTDTATAIRAASSSGVKGKGKGECVVALFDFAGENDDEISFQAGQRLWKTGEVNGWYIGTLDGTERVGIFPSNFVESAPNAAGTITTTGTTGATTTIIGGSEMKEKTSVLDMDEEVGVVAGNKSSAYGAGSGKSGDIPLSAAPPSVQRTKSTAFAAAEVATLAQMAADSQAPDTPRTSISGRRPSLPASATTAGVVVGGIEPDAIALYRFQATSNDQLSFDKGAKLLIKATLNGWYVGQEIGRDALGIFPANYVQKVDKSEAAAAAATGIVVKAEESNNGGRVAGAMADEDAGSEQSYRYKQRLDAPQSTTTSATQQTAAASEASVVIGRVTALYDFHSTTADSLSFNKGDEIAVVKEIKGWWAGSVVGRDGKLGLVPSNYCTPLRPEPAVATGASVVGGQYPVVGASSGVVKDMKVEQVITPAQQIPAAQSTVVVNTSAAAITPAAVGGVSAASVASPSSVVGRQSAGSAPPLLSAKPALLSSLAAQANGNGSPNMAVGSRPSLQPVQPAQTVQPAQSAQPIMQPIAVIEPTATPASTTSATTNTTATTTTTTPATATTPAITTTHTPAVVVAGPPTIPTTTTASSATPVVAAAAMAAQSSFVRQPTDRLAIADHDWETTERGELSFKKDDRIVVTREKNGWFTGYVEGTSRKGMFPSTFVRLVQENGVASVPQSSVVAASIAPTVTNTPVTSRPPSPTNGHQRAASTSVNQPPMSQPLASASTSTTADPSSHPALVQLSSGQQVTKLDSHGYPKTVRLYIEREKLSRGKRGDWIVRWDTKKFNKREAQLTLAKCRVKRGLRVQEAGGTGVQNAFTVLSPIRNLQVICGKEADRELWMQAFAVLGVPLEDGGSGVGVASSMNGGGSMTREQSMKRAGTPAPSTTATTVADTEEVVSMHDILAQGPPTPAGSRVNMEEEPMMAANRQAPVTAGMMVVQQPQQLQQPQRLQQPGTGSARIVQALYDFGSEAEDLPMVAGDRIELIEASQEEQWWRGRNLSKAGNRIGMFPRSYVSEVVETFAVLKPVASVNSMNSVSQASVAASNSRPSSRASNGPAPVTATTAVNTFTPIATIAPPSSQQLPSSTGTGASVPFQHPKVRALYDFETDLVKHPNDLPFRQGDVLTLLSKDNEWWTGVDSRGRKGMFPATFVKEIM